MTYYTLAEGGSWYRYKPRVKKAEMLSELRNNVLPDGSYTTIDWETDPKMIHAFRFSDGTIWDSVNDIRRRYVVLSSS